MKGQEILVPEQYREVIIKMSSWNQREHYLQIIKPQDESSFCITDKPVLSLLSKVFHCSNKLVLKIII